MPGPRRLFRAWPLLACLAGPARAADLPPDLRPEIRAVVLRLVDLTLSPGQAGRIDDENLLRVPLPRTSAPGERPEAQGVLVPYLVEGPGSFAGFYAALCAIDPANPGDVYDRTWHPHVRLLGFAAFDNQFRPQPRWSAATVAPGLVTVPVDFRDCNGHHGAVTFHLTANPVGPAISTTRDAGATLRPDACLPR